MLLQNNIIWTLWSMPMKVVAPGMKPHAGKQPDKDTWMFWSMLERGAVHGMKTHVSMLLHKVILKSSDILMTMAALGLQQLSELLLWQPTWNVWNMLMILDVHGMKRLYTLSSVLVMRTRSIIFIVLGCLAMITDTLWKPWVDMVIGADFCKLDIAFASSL